MAVLIPCLLAGFRAADVGTDVTVYLKQLTHAVGTGHSAEASPSFPLSTPLNMRCLYYMPTRRKVDLCNLLEATCDIFVEAGVLEDDNSAIVVSHDGSRVLYDKDNPRVEICLEVL